jgi:hypothetical protein
LGLLLYKLYLASSEFELHSVLNDVKLVLQMMEIAESAWVLEVGDVSEVAC